MEFLSKNYATVLDKGLELAIEKGVEDIDFKTKTEIAEAWEHAESWRFAMVLMWARRISRHSDEEEALHRSIDFAFKFLGVRFVGLFFDVLCTLFHHDPEQTKRIYQIARQSPYITKANEEAALFGMTGSHYYSPERYRQIENLDRNQ